MFQSYRAWGLQKAGAAPHTSDTKVDGPSFVGSLLAAPLRPATQDPARSFLPELRGLCDQFRHLTPKSIRGHRPSHQQQILPRPDKAARSPFHVERQPNPKN